MPALLKTIARKERKTGNWFVGGITDEHSREVEIDFGFLEKNVSYNAIIYRDGKDAHWDKNPLDIDIGQSVDFCKRS